MTHADGLGAEPPRVLVIGLGNPDRGEDGIDALVAQQLIGRLPADVAVRVRNDDLVSLIDD